jgi:hypothetical protein
MRGSDPLGAMVSTPSVSLSMVDPFSGFDTSISVVAGGGRGRCFSPRSSFCE